MSRSIFFGAVMALAIGFTSLGLTRAVYASTDCHSVSATFNDQGNEEPSDDRWDLNCDGDCAGSQVCDPYDYSLNPPFEFKICRCVPNGWNDAAACRIAAVYGQSTGAYIECQNNNCSPGCTERNNGSTATCTCP